MKRFVTYLYEYENGHKTRNAGFLRVDIRNQMVNIQVNIRCPELGNGIGNLYIIVEDKNMYAICLGEIQMNAGQYQGTVNCRYQQLGESPYSFSDAVGISISYENGCYFASSWKDEADEVIASGRFVEYGANLLSVETSNRELTDEVVIVEKNNFSTETPTEKEATADMLVEDEWDEHEGVIEAAALMEIDSTEASNHNRTNEESFSQGTYQKINLNEIASLPSSNWHYINNSFLIHGFWNYGYLVLKETVEKGEKKRALGVPGIFEQPEMVMATYFGFSSFEALPSQVVEMVVGESYQTQEKEKNQEPKAGTLGCWFASL